MERLDACFIQCEVRYPENCPPVTRYVACHGNYYLTDAIEYAELMPLTRAERVIGFDFVRNKSPKIMRLYAKEEGTL